MNQTNDLKPDNADASQQHDKQAETNGEMFRLMVESLKDYALLMLDSEGRVVTWNTGAQRIVGYTADEITGRDYAIFFTPEDIKAGKPQQELQQAEASGRYETEGWRVRKDGSRFWASVVTTALREPGGKLRGFTKVTRDMTQPRQAEQAIRDTAAQMQGVIKTAVDGIIAIDERGRIEWLNPSALRIFGYTQEELIGQNIKVLMPDPYHTQHDQYLSNYHQTGQAKIIGIGREVKGRRKDGSIFPIDLAVSEVKLGDRRMFTGIVRDITLRKEAEQSLVVAKESAEAARESAEAANKAKDQFLAMVSHELRTPLTPILAAVSFLELKTEIDPEVQEEISTIRRNVEHEAQLVDDLLNLTRLSRGKIELHFEIVDVHILLHNLLSQFESEAAAKNIELTAELRAGDHYIWADPKRILQVLNNLLHNAIKFTTKAGHISIRTTNVGEHELQIELADSGIGIEPEVLNRLFHPFEQGDTAITRQFGGLGLGLAISKGIVDLHGGSLTASSPGKNKGAIFCLKLSTVPAVPEPKVPMAATPAQNAAYRLLLVEDHGDTLRIMAKLLKSLGYVVLTASTVREAVQLADKEKFDVLVSDIGLPDGSGLDVVRLLQAKQGHTIKAIALSGFGQPEDLHRSRAAGFMDHLIKPVDFQKLEAVLRQLTTNN